MPGRNNTRVCSESPVPPQMPPPPLPAAAVAVVEVEAAAEGRYDDGWERVVLFPLLLMMRPFLHESCNKGEQKMIINVILDYETLS